MTDTETQAAGVEEGRESWFLLMDPEWAPADDDDVPPTESIIGVWTLERSGNVGPFRTNPGYHPVNDDSPLDPLDAVLRQLVTEAAEPEQVQLLLRDMLFDIAMNGDGRPLIISSPDQSPCAVIATAQPYREQVYAPLWRRIDLDDLVELLDDKIDVLFNPGGPAPVRLVGDFVRHALAISDDEAADRYRAWADGEAALDIVRWDLPDVGSDDGADGGAPAGRPATEGTS